MTSLTTQRSERDSHFGTHHQGTLARRDLGYQPATTHKWLLCYTVSTLLPRFARDAVVPGWISFISAFPARRFIQRKSKRERHGNS